MAETPMLENYAECLANLQSTNVGNLAAYCDEQVEFIDPFNHSHGVGGFIAVMTDMFVSLQDVKFVVHDVTANAEGGYLHWTYSASSKLTGAFSVDGVSLIKLSPEGKVLRHEDIWDASRLMQALPLLGRAIAYTRRRAGHCPH